MPLLYHFSFWISYLNVCICLPLEISFLCENPIFAHIVGTKKKGSNGHDYLQKVVTLHNKVRGNPSDLIFWNNFKVFQR